MRRRQMMQARNKANPPGAPEEPPAREPLKPALTCPECGQSFKNMAGLRGHVRHKHVDSRNPDW
jgi:hypothetical protein